MAQDDTPAVIHDRYRIEQVIGEGPFSRVYRAVDTRLRLHVALVELLIHRVVRDATAWEARRAALLHEATLLAGVRHRHIVAVYAHFTDEPGNLFLVREYVAGGTLRQLLARVPRQRMGRAVTVTQDLLAGLAALHRRGITHAALTPERVLLAPPPRPGEPELAKITDFGDARTGEAGDSRADLYAVGALLYEMLVGERLGDDHRPITRDAAAMPAALAALLARALDPDPAARFAHAEAMVQALTRLDLGDAAGQTLETWARATSTATSASLTTLRPTEQPITAQTPVVEPVPAVLPAAAALPAPHPAPAVREAETPPVMPTAPTLHEEAGSSPGNDDLMNTATESAPAPVSLPAPPLPLAPEPLSSSRAATARGAVEEGPPPAQPPASPPAPLAAVSLPDDRRERLAAAWRPAPPPPVELPLPEPPEPPEPLIAPEPVSSPVAAATPAPEELPASPLPVEFADEEYHVVAAPDAPVALTAAGEDVERASPALPAPVEHAADASSMVHVDDALPAPVEFPPVEREPVEPSRQHVQDVTPNVERSGEREPVEVAPVPPSPPDAAPFLLAPLPPPSLPSSSPPSVPPAPPTAPAPPLTVSQPPESAVVALPVPPVPLDPAPEPEPEPEREPEPPPPAIRPPIESGTYVRRSRSGQRWLRWLVPVVLAVMLAAAIGPTLLRRGREGSVTATPLIVSAQRVERGVGTATPLAVAPIPTGVPTATLSMTLPAMPTAVPALLPTAVAPTGVPSATMAAPLATVAALPPAPSFAPRPAPTVTPPAVPVPPVLVAAPSDYMGGIAALDRGEYDLAVMLLARAQGENDAPRALAYAQGMVAVGTEAYDEAVRAFTAAGSFRDATQRVRDSRVLAAEQGAYRAGERAAADGDLIEAIRQFAAAGDYRDATTRLAQVQDEQTVRLRYGDAQALLQERKYAEAYAILEEIERFRPGYRDVPRLLANLTGDVLPVTLDLRVLDMSKDAAHLTPVFNLIGRPVAYLRLSPAVEYRGGTSAFVGGVRVEVIVGSEPNAPRAEAATPVFIAADEPALRASARAGEQVIVAARGETWQVPGVGDYTATFAVRDATTRPEGATLPDGTRARASTFRTLVLDVALRR